MMNILLFYLIVFVFVPEKHHQLLHLPPSSPMYHQFAMLSSVVAALLGSATYTNAFQYGRRQLPININKNNRPSTSLFLEDHIANMIDNEMRRLYSKHETDVAWKDKQRAWAAETKPLPKHYAFVADEFNDMSPAAVLGFTSGVDRSISGPRRRKDEKMAKDDPMRYCADRCVTTGNCDVFEDIFDMKPEDVIKFCKDCVLSEDEEPCDVPATMFEDESSGGNFGKMHP